MPLPDQAVRLVLSIAEEALAEADQAVKVASARDAELSQLRRELSSGSTVKRASDDFLRKVAGHLQSVGLPLVAEADLSTHEGTLAALQKFADFHQKSIAALFDDPHGRPIKQQGAEGASAASQSGESRFSGWDQAVSNVKKAKKRY